MYTMSQYGVLNLMMTYERRNILPILPYFYSMYILPVPLSLLL